MAGQRTRIRFGSVSAEVLLEKTSTKPKAAQHETRRVLAEPVEHDATIETPAGPVVLDHKTATDPFGDPVAAPFTNAATGERLVVPERRPDPADAPGGLPPGLLGPMGDPTWPPPHAREPVAAPDPEPDAADGPGSRVERQAAAARDVLDSVPPYSVPESAPASAQTYTPLATKVEQGVHLEDGTWVDLTDRLTEVDRRTRVDGLEVVRTIPASSYASERVREAHYLCGVDPDTFKVLALLWRALRSERMAAEVRWTKRTAQASGIIVARGELPTTERPKPAVPAHLLLLELEWAAQIKRVPPRARGPIMADVAVDEVVAAVELVQSFAAPAPREELRDERLAKRAELLEFARAGKLAEYEPPAEPMPVDLVDGLDVELAEAMALAASWNREHAPA